MLMMTSQILKSAGFTRTQKSRYLENETFFIQIKKTINYHSWKIESLGGGRTKFFARKGG